MIKLAPVVAALEARPGEFSTCNVGSGQHTDLVHPFAREFGLRIDSDLGSGAATRTPIEVLHRVVQSLAEFVARDRPDLMLVQGDTTTALAGALVGAYMRVRIGHVEAGLRSGVMESPFPEELNRQLISRAARYHFAATAQNRDNLLSEGIADRQIVVTGNPVVDSVQWIMRARAVTPRVEEIRAQIGRRKLVLLSTHRRESFGEVMAGRLRVLREFVARHDDVVLVFPVHPNPEVRSCSARYLANQPRILLVEPLGYADFIHLMSVAWLIVSDSGGVQEEAPTVGRPLLVIRDRTERPEVVDAGFARLVGESSDALSELLEESHRDLGWYERNRSTENPFGRGDAGTRIVDALVGFAGGRDG